MLKSTENIQSLIFFALNSHFKALMKWQTIGGRCIYRTTHGIEVFDNYFFRWLKIQSPHCKNNTLQTLLNKNAPYKPCLNYIPALTHALSQNPGNCCLLGLGGAAVAHAAFNLMSPFKWLAVEIDNQIIDVASRFFMLDTLINLEVTNQDANYFVTRASQQFKHILVDLFTSHCFPENCNHGLFFAHCRELLVADGILALNIPNAHEQYPLFKLIKLHFTTTVIIPIKKSANIVILASKSEKLDLLLTYFKKNSQVKRLIWNNYWGYLAELRN